MPAMAPEDRCEDELEVVGPSNGLDPDEDDSEALGLLETGDDDSEALELLERLESGEDEDVVASTPDQQVASRL